MAVDTESDEVAQEIGATCRNRTASRCCTTMLMFMDTRFYAKNILRCRILSGSRVGSNRTVSYSEATFGAHRLYRPSDYLDGFARRRAVRELPPDR